MAQSTAPQPQRRSADRFNQSAADRERVLRLLFVSILVVSVGGFGWWAWRKATGAGLVRNGAPSWSADSKRVIFTVEDQGKTDLYIAEVNGGSRQQLTRTPQDEGSPAFSPDGSEIAFDSDREGNFEIYVMTAGGEAARRRTDHPGRDLAPSWSPDGTQIVFMSSRTNPDFDIYRMNKDGSNLQPIVTGGSNAFPQYSQDGGRLAFHSGRDTFVLTFRTSRRHRVTYEPLNGMYPTWSPDGKRIAFMSWRNGRSEIFTASPDGSEQQLLVTMPTGDAVDPRWSPNGESIAFVHIPGGMAAALQDKTDPRIVMVVDVNSGRLTRVSR